MEQQTVTPAAVTPPPVTLREHIAAEESTPPAETPAPAKVDAPPIDETTVAAEADSPKPDADLSEAARALRANRKDERIKRLKAETDELARELHRRKELRSELDRLATGQPATAGATTQPAGTTHADPRDPEPTFDSVIAKYPNETDPYGRLTRELAAWDRRQETRAADAERRAAAQRTTSEQTRAQLQARADESRAKYGDYDAVVLAFDQALGDHPAQDAIARFVARSKVGGDLAYHLGKSLAAVQAAIADGPEALWAHLGAVEAAFTASAKAPATTITAAPPPPSQTAGGAAPATEPDTRKGVPLKDHIRIEEAEIAERRKRGLRY